MSWQDDIRQPSINGVNFEVKSSSTSGGANLQDGKEKKEVEKPGILRNGREIRKFSVEGFVIGEDYLAQAGKIETELDKQENARLVHPTYGTLLVDIKGYSIKQVAGQGRKIEFSFTCWEAGVISYPKKKKDKIGQAEAVKKEVDKVLIEDFEKKFSVAGKPQFVKDSAKGLIESASDKFDSMTSGIANASDAIGDGAFQAKKMYNEAAALIEKPADLANRLQFNMALAEKFSDNPRDLFSAYRKTSSFTPPQNSFTASTSTRAQELTNQKQVTQMVKASGLTRAVVQGITLSEGNSIKTKAEAEEMRDSLLDDLDSLMESTENDSLFIQLSTLKAQVIEGIPGENNALPNLMDLDIKNTTNSLALAYELNESLDLETDIVDRNKIGHAGFITPRKLEVVL